MRVATAGGRAAVSWPGRLVMVVALLMRQMLAAAAARNHSDQAVFDSRSECWVCRWCRHPWCRCHARRHPRSRSGAQARDQHQPRRSDPRFQLRAAARRTGRDRPPTRGRGDEHQLDRVTDAQSARSRSARPPRAGVVRRHHDAKGHLLALETADQLAIPLPSAGVADQILTTRSACHEMSTREPSTNRQRRFGEDLRRGRRRGTHHTPCLLRQPRRHRPRSRAELRGV